MRETIGDYRLLLVLLCACILPVHGSDTGIVHYEANVRFDVEKNAAQTRVCCTLRNGHAEPLSELHFDVFARETRCKVHTEIREVRQKVGGATVPVPFEHAGESSGTRLAHVTLPHAIAPGATAELIFDYSWQATDPTNARDNYRPFATLPNGEKEVCLLADFAWLPVLREDASEISETSRTQRFPKKVKPSWDIRMDVPEEYLAVLLEGARVRQERRNNRAVSEWTSTAPCYPQAMVGRFDKKVIPGRSMQVAFYLPNNSNPPFLEQMGRTLADAYDAYCDLFGPLEGEEIRVCVSSAGQGGHGGYLSFTMDTRMLGGQLNKKNLPMVMEMMTHELAHAWWGQSVSSYGKGTKFLRESLANFSSWYLSEKMTGQDRFGAELAKLFWTGLHRDVLCMTDRDSQRAAYFKGPVVLNMLRHDMGDPHFFAVLRRFAQAHRGGHATMSDFIATCNEVSGRDWTPFFEDFCFSDAVPDYKVVRFRSAREGEAWKTEVQLHNAGRGVITCPVDLCMDGRAQRESCRVPTGKTETLTFTTSAQVRDVIVDPDHRAFQGSGRECRLKMLGVGEVNMEWIWYWRGVVMAEEGQYDEAIEGISRAVSVHEHPAFSFSRGITYLRKGDRAAARADLKDFMNWMAKEQDPVRSLVYPGLLSSQQSRQWEQLNRILEMLTGQELRTHEQWRTWWQTNGADFQPAESATSLGPGGPAGSDASG